MAKGCRDPRNWDRILARRSERQWQAIRELQSADEQTRVLAVHKLCPCRPGNLELFEEYLYPLRHDPSSRVRQAVNEAFNEGLERVRLRDRRALRADSSRGQTSASQQGTPGAVARRCPAE